MTTQEFVKKEAGQYVGVNAQSYNYRHGFTDGLTKGLEIMELFQQFVEHGYFKVMGKYMLKYGRLEDVESHKTRGELLTIFLTEKYGK